MLGGGELGGGGVLGCQVQQAEMMYSTQELHIVKAIDTGLYICKWDKLCLPYMIVHCIDNPQSCDASRGAAI